MADRLKHRIKRRRLLGATAVLGAVFLVNGFGPASATWFPPTPEQPTGPFYFPFKPLAIDNDSYQTSLMATVMRPFSDTKAY